MSQTIDYIKTSDDFKTYIQKNPFLMNHLTRPKTNFLIENDYPNFRAYKDESTNIYNKIFFNNKKMLHYFLYFCYHQINYDIMTNINISLIKINTILKSSEEIFLISKGGNIITLYINKFLNKLSKENVNTIKENTKLGSISDTDLTIYLLTEDEYRFNLIYSQLSPILYSSCEKISNFFDEKIEFKKNRNTPNKSTILNNPNYLIIDKNKYSLIDIHKIDKNISENIENNSIESINEAKNIIKNLIFKDKKFVIMDDIYIGTRYIKILQTIKYYRNLLNFNINIDNIISYQKKLIELKLKNISLKFNNFYTKDNVKAFLNELTNQFNKDYIGQQYYEYIKPNDLPIKKYELKSIIKEQDNTYTGAGLGLNLERKNDVENGSTNHNNSNNSSISNNNQFESKKNTTQLNKKIYTRLYNSNNNQSNINNNQSNSKKNTTQINKKMYTRLYNSNNNQSNSNNNQSNSNNNQSNSKKKNNTNQNDEYKQNKIILISSDFDVEYVTINNKNKIIKLVKRSNLIIRNIEDYKFNRLLESVEKKYHYVSINSTINNIVDNHIVTFDLYRIKLNVELPNISISKFDEINKNKLIFKSSNNNLYNISIPAEFLDISIPKFNDINLSKFRDNFNLESFNTFFSILNFTDNDISYLNIITYSLEYLLDDLNLILFKQNTFMPWIDSKYEKRINRLCCLSLLLIIKNSKKYGFKSAKIQNQNINENQQLVSKTNRNQFKYGNKIKNIIEDLSLLKDNFKKNYKNIKLNKSNTDKTNNIIKKNIKNTTNDCLFNQEIITNFLHSNKYFNFDNNNHYIKNIFSDSFEFIYNIINLEINGDKNNSLTKYLIYKLKQYNYTFLNESIKSTYVSFTYKENFITFLETYIKWLTYWNNKFFDKNNIFNEIDFDSINIII